MPEPVRVLAIAARRLAVSGSQHEGWQAVPAQADAAVEFTLRIEFDGYGYLLCIESRDGSFYADSWHAAREEAERAAEEEFGVGTNDWQHV